MMKMILILLLIFNATKINAYSEFYQQHNRGWHWYEERKKVKDAEEIEHSEKSNITATEQLEKFQKNLEETKAAMIMNPSVENTKRYIQYQNEAFRKADQVSKYWKIAMLEDESLNIVKDLPISDVGAKLAEKRTATDEKQILQNFAKKFKLLFFYKKSCNYCAAFADVLEVFSYKYNYKVAAVTLDGGKLDKFPAITNPALAEKLNVTYTPSLFVYSEELKIATPVAHGYLSIDLLEKNMAFIAKQLEGKL